MEETASTEINPELQLAEQFVEQTASHLFLTGKAGTGKTTFLKNLQLKSAKNMIVTAPTGVAAINAGGVTLHSFFQLPLGPYVPGGEVHDPGGRSKFRFSRQKREIVNRLDLLVIDEISMVRADILDAVDAVLRRYRGIDAPFGGIQLLMIGDLHQLPPVVKPVDWDLLRPFYDTAYFFSSLALRQTGFTTIELKRIYRQSDPGFIRILNQLRDNRLDEQSMESLGNRYLKGFTPKAGQGFITLTTHNAGATRLNISQLKALDGDARSYSAEIRGEFPENIYPAPSSLDLKKGAQVMFLRNETSLDRSYFNGKIGLVERLSPDGIDVICPGETEAIRVQPVEWENIRYRLHPEKQKVEEEIIGTFKQYPLKLAWAITIHKSQGLTFERAIIDAEDAFVHGQAYVALSRCRSLDGVVLSSPLSAYGIEPDRALLSFDRHIRNNPPTTEQLGQAKIRYQQKMLTACFDFSKLQYMLNRFLKLVMDHKGSVAVLGLEELQRASQQTDQDLFSVAAKFTQQLTRLFQEGNLPENDPQILERLQKASVWFTDQLTTSVFNPLQEVRVETDNSILKAMLNETLRQLRREIDVKRAGIRSLASGFVPSEYQRQVYLAVTRKEPTPSNADAPILTRAEQKLEHAELFARLKIWRAEKARRLDVSAHQLLRRSAMLEIVRMLPDNWKDLKRVKGVGKQTLAQSGKEIVAMVSAYRQEFKITTEKTGQKQNTVSDTRNISFNLFEQGLTIEEISKQRGLVPSTIESHLCTFVESGQLSIDRLISKEKQAAIARQLDLETTDSLSNVKEQLGDGFSYGEIRFVLADQHHRDGS
ncbi:helix-turn-helix domain-containing protein [bacterium]|nr:helix-turn-helix domain-containing protein [bacterium]